MNIQEKRKLENFAKDEIRDVATILDDKHYDMVEKIKGGKKEAEILKFISEYKQSMVYMKKLEKQALSKGWHLAVRYNDTVVINMVSEHQKLRELTRKRDKKLAQLKELEKEIVISLYAGTPDAKTFLKEISAKLKKLI